MVGGMVCGVVRGPESTLLNVTDKPYSVADYTTIRIIERRRIDSMPVKIAVGDSVWWEGGNVMWTPAPRPSPRIPGEQGETWDVILPRANIRDGRYVPAPTY